MTKESDILLKNLQLRTQLWIKKAKGMGGFVIANDKDYECCLNLKWKLKK